MNPLFRREFLARWRDKRSHLLLLALALLLAVAAYHSYDNALNLSVFNQRVYPPALVIESVTTRSSRAGHALFSTLAVGNVGAWFVLAPLLLATGVARERECGLLESLQLAPMKPVSQILARALSALSYLAILQLVTLPIYFVAFSFGGVSELEILRVWEIAALSAFCGVGLGLALSAQSPRPSGALFGAVALLVGWSVLAFFAANFGYWFFFFGLGSGVYTLNAILFYGHPVAMVWNLCNTTTTSVSLFTTWARFFPKPEEYFFWDLLGWGLVGTIGLAKATRDVTRPLPPASWAGRNTLIQKWKRRREEPLLKQRERQRSRVSVEGALLADLPFDRLIRFKNPLLNREVKSRFRLRRASAFVWTGRAAIFLVGAGVWVMAFFAVFFDPPGRANAVHLVLWNEWLLGTALIGTFAASSFVREREAGTWEGLRLSLLTPLQVAVTKWASPLVTFAFLSCPLWLLLWFLVPVGTWSGMPFRWILLEAAVVVSSLSLISAVGCWVSLRAKNTTSATCWTLGVLLSLFVGAPFASENLDLPNRLVKWRYGMDGELSRYSYDAPQNLALYTQQTGRHAPSPYSIGQTPALIKSQQWASYYEWFNRATADVQRFKTLFYFWNPSDVLTAMQQRVAPGYRSAPTLYLAMSDNENAVTMALMHIVFMASCTTVILLRVQGQLKKRLD